MLSWDEILTGFIINSWEVNWPLISTFPWVLKKWCCLKGAVEYADADCFVRFTYQFIICYSVLLWLVEESRVHNYLGIWSPYTKTISSIDKVMLFSEQVKYKFIILFSHYTSSISRGMALWNSHTFTTKSMVAIFSLWINLKVLASRWNWYE